MWLFTYNHTCFGYIQITTLNNKNTFGAPYIPTKFLHLHNCNTEVGLIGRDSKSVWKGIIGASALFLAMNVNLSRANLSEFFYLLLKEIVFEVRFLKMNWRNDLRTWWTI